MSTSPFDHDDLTPVTSSHPHPVTGSPVPSSLLTAAYAFTAPWEGSYNHMYLDTRGFVTCGVGFMLPSARAAALCPFTPSTEIAADFATIASKPVGRLAGWYKQFTRCVLSETYIRAHFSQLCVGLVGNLRRDFPNYDLIPPPAQLALLDMAFNLGSAKLNTEYVHLKMAVAAQDWKTAATQCSRRGPSPARNAATAALFIAAHEQVYGHA